MLWKILYMPYYGTAYVTLRYTVQHTLNSGNKYYYNIKSEITWQIFSLTYFPNYFTVLYWLPIYLTDFEYHAGLIDWPLNYRADLDWPLNYSAGLDWPLNYRADLDWPLNYRADLDWPPYYYAGPDWSSYYVADHDWPLNYCAGLDWPPDSLAGLLITWLAS